MPPELIIPASATIRTDTATVTRGPVAEVTRHNGAVLTNPAFINFGELSASFGRFYVQLGDTVNQGQLLARLDFEHIQQRIIQQEENIAAMRRQHSLDNGIRALDLDIMTAENNRQMQQAAENNNLDAMAAAERGRWEIDRVRMELGFARERQALSLSHEENVLNALRQQFEHSELRAPFDGVIAFISDLSPGKWVTPFSTIVGIVPENYCVFVEYVGGTSLFIHRAARIQAHVDGQVYDATRIYLTREQAQQYAHPPLRFTLDTEDPPPVGSFVSLYIYTHWEEDTLRIPRNALHYDPDMGFYVHRVDETQLTQVFVTVGIRTETYVAILSGLWEGDVVSVRL